MLSFLLKNTFFLVSLLGVIGLSSIRSFPVYGKLDFILLDGRTWWKPLQPMIEEIIAQGDDEILSDMITCTILRGVFAQKAVAFRFDRHYSHVQVEEFLKSNRERVMPFGAASLLLHEDSHVAENLNLQIDNQRISVRQILIDAAMMTDERKKDAKVKKNYPYRCLINLHGFASSWVPGETGHWSEKWSKPYLMYEFQGKHGKEIEPLLRGNPPDNCMVYY